MKKILSALLVMVMLFSVMSCITVGALGDSTADEVTDVDVNTGIDPELDQQIKKDAYENFYNGRVDFEDIVITYFGALSDGTPVVNVNYNGKGCLNAYMTDIVGDYYYSYDICCERAYIYRDNDFVFIEDAYDTGLIGDKNLAELCEISKEYSKHIYNDCCFYFYPINDESDSETTEPTTQPETTIAEETKPTSLEDVKSSTSDTPEIKTSASSDTAKIANANGSNGTVQTGQSNSLILLTLLLIVLATTTAVFIKFRCRD